jgi:hypothetical protein
VIDRIIQNKIEKLKKILNVRKKEMGQAKQDV